MEIQRVERHQGRIDDEADLLLLVVHQRKTGDRARCHAEQLFHQLAARKGQTPRPDQLVQLVQLQLAVCMGRDKDDDPVLILHEEVLRMPTWHRLFQLASFFHGEGRLVPAGLMAEAELVEIGKEVVRACGHSGLSGNQGAGVKYAARAKDRPKDKEAPHGA